MTNTEKEKKTPATARKEIIKTIAIVFLAVMLVLTFFSNTIMNMSLPQVSVQCAESGEVNEQIRGSGNISAGKSYSVKSDETRVVSAVHVKVGDTVNKGDVIYSLEGTESTELAEAEKTLRNLTFDYRKALAAAGEGAGYLAERFEIECAKEDIADIEYDIERYDSSSYLREKYSSDFISEEKLESEVLELRTHTNSKYKDISDIDLEILQSDTDSALAGIDSDDYTLLPANWYNKLNAAKETVDELSEDDKQSLLDKKAEIEAAIAALSTDDMLGLPSDCYARIKDALNARNDAKEDFEKAESDLKDAQAEAVNDSGDEIKSKNREIEEKMAEYNNVMNKISNFDISEGTDGISDLYEQADSISREIRYLNEDLAELMEDQNVSNNTKQNIYKKQTLYNKYKKIYESAEKELEKIKKQIKEELIEELMSVKQELESMTDDGDGQNRLNEAKKNLNELKSEAKKELKSQSAEISAEITNRKNLSEKEEALESAKSALSVKIAEDKKALEDSLKEKEKNLKTLENNLTVKQSSDSVANTQAEIELERQEQDIADAREKVRTLKEKSLGGEITAPVSGTVSSLALSAGESTVPGNDAAVIDMTDKGFIVSFSVKTEQARKLTVGTSADVTSNYFGGDISAVLSNISNDSANPQTNKILEFTVTGEDVHTGDSISLSIGSKGQNYPAVVPNSAVREDNNGKYVLVCESKNSALGTRYFAVRYSVNVLASNDSKTAVGGLTGSEFVITASSDPIEDGAQVKLAE